MSRDYAAEMRAVMDAAAPPGTSYNLPLAAAELVDKLEHEDCDLLVGWLRMHAVSLLREAMDRRDRSYRSATSQGRGRARFQAAADATSSGRCSGSPASSRGSARRARRGWGVTSSPAGKGNELS